MNEINAGKKIQICDKCKEPTPHTAGMMYKNRITWLCYRCYQEQKGKRYD